MLLFIDIDGDKDDDEEDEDGGSVIINILAAMLYIDPTAKLVIVGFVSFAFLRFKKPNFPISADKSIKFLLKTTTIFAAAYAPPRLQNVHAVIFFFSNVPAAASLFGSFSACCL
jgi:hypothetical protein